MRPFFKRCSLIASEPDVADANHAPLADAARRLRGAGLEVAELPMPSPLRRGAERLPASHANFYLANGVALVPVFGGASDREALSILQECLPEREIVGIDSRALVVGLGAVHCLTQQVPRGH